MEMRINSGLVKKLRAKRLLSQEELATACGVSLRTIQRLEGESNASPETVKAVAAVFEVSYEYLLAGSDSAGEYKNVQFGTVLVIAAVLVTLTLTVLLGSGFIENGVFLPGIIVMTLICGLFSVMTTRVTENKVEWCFTFGFWRKSVSLNEIQSFSQVRNKYWWGLGIRLIPGGWLYCVSGLYAVEMKLENGKVVRVGTDEPEQLFQAIDSAILEAGE